MPLPLIGGVKIPTYITQSGHRIPLMLWFCFLRGLAGSLAWSAVFIRPQTAEELSERAAGRVKRTRRKHIIHTGDMRQNGLFPPSALESEHDSRRYAVRTVFCR
jgi:hypothetical protein